MSNSVAGHRSSPFDADVASRLLDLIASGKSMVKACEAIGLRRQLVWGWLSDNADFATKYARACEERATALAEEALEIGDSADGDSNSQVAKAKLRADTRKWFAARMAPRKWGDRVALTGGDGGPLQVQTFTDLVRSADDE